MPKILNKARRYRLPETTIELLDKMKAFHNESKFVREAIREKFERDHPVLIKEQQERSEIQLPF